MSNKVIVREQKIEVNPLETLNIFPVKNWDYPRILMAVLVERSLPDADKVLEPFMILARTGVDFVVPPYGRTDVVRNKLGMVLLSSDYTHVLMLDNDHIHPSNIIHKLARWILMAKSEEEEPLVVGGLNYTRMPPFYPCAFIKPEGDDKHRPITEYKRGLIPVDAVGTGSILISRKVFERIKPPWFYNIYDEVDFDNWPGEDIGFSINCKREGIQCWVDTTVSSPHMTATVVTEDVYKRALAGVAKDVKFVSVKDVQTREAGDE